jgi:hypothetical protein
MRKPYSSADRKPARAFPAHPALLRGRGRRYQARAPTKRLYRADHL